MNLTHNLHFEKQILVHYHFFAACVLYCSKTQVAALGGEQSELLGMFQPSD